MQTQIIIDHARNLTRRTISALEEDFRRIAGKVPAEIRKDVYWCYPNAGDGPRSRTVRLRWKNEHCEYDCSEQISVEVDGAPTWIQYDTFGSVSGWAPQYLLPGEGVFVPKGIYAPGELESLIE